MNMKEYKEKYPDFDKILQGRKMTLKKPCGGRKPEGDPIPLFKPVGPHIPVTTSFEPDTGGLKYPDGRPRKPIERFNFFSSRLITSVLGYHIYKSE